MLPLVVLLLGAANEIPPPVRVERLGSLPRGAPAPRLRLQGHGYTLAFGRQDVPVNQRSTEMGQSPRFQLTLSGGKRVTVGWVGKPVESQLCLRFQGQDEPITFDTWYRAFVVRGVTGKDLNELKYSMNRGFIAPKCYEFFGLTQAHGTAYVGVVWYDPMNSVQGRGDAIVFKLIVSGGKLTPVPVRKVPLRSRSVHGTASPPLMDSASGDLLVFDGSALQRLTRDGKWAAVRRTPKELLEEKSDPVEIWLRGRYLVRGKSEYREISPGRSRSSYTFLVMDAITGRKLRRYRWTDAR